MSDDIKGMPLTRIHCLETSSVCAVYVERNDSLPILYVLNADPGDFAAAYGLDYMAVEALHVTVDGGGDALMSEDWRGYNYPVPCARPFVFDISGRDYHYRYYARSFTAHKDESSFIKAITND